MNYMRLLKLLYIAERECIRDAGRGLTGSSVVAMERGPVLEDVLHLIRNEHHDSPDWSNHFQTDGYHLVMTNDPGADILSPFVSRKLSEVARRHELDDEWAMVEFTHTLPEWVKNNPGQSSKHIPLADILEAVGKLDDMDRIVGYDRNLALNLRNFSGNQRTTGSDSPSLRSAFLSLQ
jgi:uncharacterized phage-associated protein